MPALPVVTGAFVAGTLLGALLGGPVTWTMLLVATTVIAVTLRSREHLSWLVLIAAVAFAGVGHLRALSAAESQQRSEAIEGTHVLSGVVESPPDVRGTTRFFSLLVDEVDGAPRHIRVRVIVPATGQVRLGDRVELSGELESPRDGASPGARQRGNDLGVEAEVAFPSRWRVIGHEPPSKIDSVLGALHERSIANIERVLREPESSLAVGMLLGVQQAMPERLTRDLRATGTIHLVVVSGQNVALVLGLAVAAMSAGIPRRRAALLALLLLPPYVTLVGAQPPVLRAALMAVGLTLADVLGRRTPGWVFLVYAAAAMLALDPRLATSLSFQLSFSATAGVLIVAPPLRDAALTRLRVTSSGALAAIIEVAAVSTGAALAVAPIQAAAFGVLPLLQIPANVLSAPLYEATLVAAALAALLGGIADLVTPLRLLLTPAPAAFLAVIRALATPRALLDTPSLSGGVTVAWYALLVAIVWLFARGKPVALAPSARSGVALSLLLLGANAGLWHAALKPTESNASVTVLDVGQGLAVLVRDGGHAVLIDAGPPDAAVVGALSRAGQFATLDALVLTHEDLDHTGGATAVERRVGARQVLAASDASHPSTGIIDIGDRMHLTARTTIEVLSPPVLSDSAPRSDNDRGLVLLVTIGERRVLLPADIEAAAETWLVQSAVDLDADALVVPHHGSKTSSTPAFLAAVHPQVAVVSVGAHNAYGHPNAEVLARYADARVLRTDEDGDVTLTSDGQRLWYHAARQ
ncbi:MAG: DNA internalization-related competence protein ComEC/Rec2 [Dehalococcoidia bacterium]|nr:DNA internalization-related competence protein ComEC/Rec2 [Dehalococcoidia bacterium]